MLPQHYTVSPAFTLTGVSLRCETPVLYFQLLHIHQIPDTIRSPYAGT